MLIKITIVNLETEEVKETHYIETDSVNRALDMFDYHILDEKEEREYHAKKLGSVGGSSTSKAKKKSSANNGRLGGRPKGSKNKPAA
jgi:hypothetical protein